MGRVLSLLLVAALLALWISGALRQQGSVGPDERTVRAQITAIAKPTHGH